MADVTITGLNDLAPSTNTYVPISNGSTTGKAIYNPVPIGGIIMWSGSIASIPTGWALCNGLNGTPDLRNQFVIGASVDVSSQSQTGVTGSNTKTGGTKDAIVVSHTHDITDNGHTHSYQFKGGNAASGVDQWNGYPGRLGNNIATTSSSTGITINSQGSSGTNQNLPPYYALAYIMRTI